MVDPVTIGFVFALIGLISTMVWFGIALFGITKLDEIKRNIVDVDRTDQSDDALAQLRERYARGELGDEEFEQKVERLVETDNTLDNQGQHPVNVTTTDPESSSDLNLETEK